MALTVREIWQMEKFKAFRLVAGEKGLDNEIENIGILDYEYAVEDEELQQKWAFGRKGFVISSLLFAKDHPERILNAFEGLVRDRVSALAVKAVCYQELPREAIEYADENNLPVFLFGRDDAYFEEIVFEIKGRISGWNDVKNMEKRIDSLIDRNLGEEERSNILKRVVKEKWRHYLVVYEKYEDGIKESELARRYRLLNDRIGERGGALIYHGGCLVILAAEKGEMLSRYTRQLLREIQPGDRHQAVGVGSHHAREDELRQAVMECLYAERFAYLKGKEEIFFDDMGVYQILFPYYKESWMKEYSRRFLGKILEFDREYDGELFQTIRIYIEQSGDIHAVSEKMHVHKNTIRYRINKVREMLNMEEDPTFLEQMSLAVRIYELGTRWEDSSG